MPWTLTPRRYFRLSLLMPFVLPAIVGTLYGVSGRALGKPPDMVVLLVASVVIGGVPYAVVASALGVLARRRGVRGLLAIGMATPIIFAFALGLFAVLAGAFSGKSPSPADIVGTLRWCTICALLFGYAYVVLALMGFGVLHRIGWIANQEG